MTKPTGASSISKKSLLTADERDRCEQIANGERPHSQRATALLCVDEGCTQSQAAAQSDLSASQVQYWVAKFKRDRMGIFPTAPTEQPAVEKEKEAAEPSDDVVEKKVKKEKKKKEKKKKSDKKKSKKEKKGKKKDKKVKSKKKK